MRALHEVLADDDYTLSWLRLAAGCLAIGLAVQAGVWAARAMWPPIHIDAEMVRQAPIERATFSADGVNAVGLAEDVAIRMFRWVDATSAEDAEWLLEHMVPELALLYEESALKSIEGARDLHVYFGGHYHAKILTVTPLKVDLPPFQVEVAVRLEPRGLEERQGVAIPDEFKDPKDLRIRLTFVRTAKSVNNRDALLIQEIRSIDESEG